MKPSFFIRFCSFLCEKAPVFPDGSETAFFCAYGQSSMVLLYGKSDLYARGKACGKAAKIAANIGQNYPSFRAAHTIIRTLISYVKKEVGPQMKQSGFLYPTVFSQLNQRSFICHGNKQRIPILCIGIMAHTALLHHSC